MDRTVITVIKSNTGVVVCASFSPVVSSALASINSRWDLPVFTLPFNILVCLHMVATGHYNHHFPQVLIQPRSELPNITWAELDVAKVSDRPITHLSMCKTSLNIPLCALTCCRCCALHGQMCLTFTLMTFQQRIL